MSVRALTCPVCGRPHEGAYAGMRQSHPEATNANDNAFKVCMACASVIANLYSMRHGGEPLTWEGAKGPSFGYQKSPIPESLRWEVFYRDKFTCVECGSQKVLTADHVIAESKGGPTTFENLRTLCRSCNSRKGAT